MCAKNCEGCIWYDLCTETTDEGCDDFYPCTPSDVSIELQEIEQDVRDRHEYYKMLIKEQNS